LFGGVLERAETREIGADERGKERRSEEAQGRGTISGWRKIWSELFGLGCASVGRRPREEAQLMKKGATAISARVFGYRIVF
jgi:hypothetical protein